MARLESKTSYSPPAEPSRPRSLPTGDHELIEGEAAARARLFPLSPSTTKVLFDAAKVKVSSLSSESWRKRSGVPGFDGRSVWVFNYRSARTHPTSASGPRRSRDIGGLFVRGLLTSDCFSGRVGAPINHTSLHTLKGAGVAFAAPFSFSTQPENRLTSCAISALSPTGGGD